METELDDFASQSDTENDTETQVDAMVDVLAAELYWHQQERWERHSRHGQMRDMAERLVADGRKPTAAEIDLLASARHRDTDEERYIRTWVTSRRVVSWLNLYDADLLSKLKFMRAADIATTAVAAVSGLLALQGLAELFEMLLRGIASLF